MTHPGTVYGTYALNEMGKHGENILCGSTKYLYFMQRKAELEKAGTAILVTLVYSRRFPKKNLGNVGLPSIYEKTSVHEFKARVHSTLDEKEVL